MTVDLEYDFETKQDKSLIEVVPKLLDFFSLHDVKATFFVLGEIAEKYPKVIKKISSEGHEIACHGYNHKRLTDLSDVQVVDELVRSKEIIEKLGVPCKGFRAPYFMFGRKLHGQLFLAGYAYSSSVSSFFPGRYSNLFVKPELFAKDGVVEMPVPNWWVKFFPSGLSYYRLFYPLSKKFKVPYMLYLHPCELLGRTVDNSVNKFVQKVYDKNLDKSWELLEQIVVGKKWVTCSQYLDSWMS